jgi:hypothetical protein
MSEAAQVIWAFGAAMLVVLVLAISALALVDAVGKRDPERDQRSRT